MHRTNSVPRSAFGLILLGLAVGHLATARVAWAAEGTEGVRPPETAEAAPGADLILVQEQVPAPRPQAGQPGLPGQPAPAALGALFTQIETAPVWADWKTIDRAETAQLALTFAEVRRERGVAILLVEHDVELVRNNVERVFVLDFGTLIAQGPTAEVMTDQAVRTAYLGEITTLQPDDPSAKPATQPVTREERTDSATTSAPLLELRDVDAGYGPFRALFGVSFSIEKGTAASLCVEGRPAVSFTNGFAVVSFPEGAGFGGNVSKKYTIQRLSAVPGAASENMIVSVTPSCTGIGR